MENTIGLLFIFVVGLAFVWYQFKVEFADVKKKCDGARSEAKEAYYLAEATERSFRKWRDMSFKQEAAAEAKKAVDRLVGFPSSVEEPGIYPSFMTSTQGHPAPPREAEVKVDLLADALGYEFNYGRATPGGAVISKRPKRRLSPL